MTTIQVEARVRIRDDYNGQTIVMEPGDRLTVPEAWAAKACGNGWCEATDGSLAVGELKRRRRVRVKPDDIVSGQANEAP